MSRPARRGAEGRERDPALARAPGEAPSEEARGDLPSTAEREGRGLVRRSPSGTVPILQVKPRLTEALAHTDPGSHNTRWQN